MEPKKFEMWLKKIATTQDEEISCSDCFELVSAYVDQELEGAQTSQAMKALKLHLFQCRACQDEYETLREFSLLERTGQFPPMDDLLMRFQ